MFSNRRGFRVLGEYVIPLVISGVVSFTAYLITIKEEPSLKISATLSAAILGYLIGDKVFLVSRLLDLEEAVLGQLKSNVKYQRFDSILGALHYVCENAHACRSIKNTRLEAAASVASSGKAKQKISEQDIAIMEAIKDGCQYTLIYESRRVPDIKYYLDEFNKLKVANKKPGQIFLYEIESGDLPLTQMTILEYKNGKREVLVGWAMGKFMLHDAPVFLVQEDTNRGLIDVFDYIFENYQRAGEPKAL